MTGCGCFSTGEADTIRILRTKRPPCNSFSFAPAVQNQIELDIAFPEIGYLASWKPIIISHVSARGPSGWQCVKGVIEGEEDGTK